MIWLLLACQEPPAPLLDRYVLPDSVGHPESVAFHAEERAFFLGSLVTGAVFRLDASGDLSTLFTPEAGWMTLGVKVAPGGEVAVCAVADAGLPEARAELWVFDLSTPEPVRVPLLGVPANCNDLAFEGDSVYLTDREAGVIHRTSLAGPAEVWFTHPALEPELIGMNGIVVTDGALLVSKYMPATLLRIPLDDPDALTTLAVPDGTFGAVPDGPDGFAWDGEDLLIAANRVVARLSSTDGWRSAEAVTVTPEAAVAAATLAEGRAYGLKGEVVPWVLGAEPALPFELFVLGE
jgi:sugar lactone lactonase YvrE